MSQKRTQLMFVSIIMSEARGVVSLEERFGGAKRVGGVGVIGWAAPTLPPGPSEPSPSSAELALSRSLEREGRCLRPLASSWARALCKLLSSLTVSGTAKSRSANRVKEVERRHMRTASPEAHLKGPPALTAQTFNKCFRVPGTGSADEMGNNLPVSRRARYVSM